MRIRSVRWCLVSLAAAASRMAFALTITEIHYQPPASGPDLRFVEVFNDSPTVADVSGWYFSSGVQFTFPDRTLIAGRAYLVVCADTAAVRAHYGIENFIGDFAGNLDPDGETLEIANNSGVREARVRYGDRGRWPSAPKGTGHTLSLRGPYLDGGDAESWSSSNERGGTPGRENFPSPGPVADPVVPAVVLNELFSPAGGDRWLELLNTTSADRDLGGYRLSTRADRLDLFTLPAGTTIPAGGRLVFSEDQTGLDLTANEILVFLTTPDLGRVVDARVCEEVLALGAAGVSLARDERSDRWGRARTPTPGAANRIDVETDLVITEIMYHPFRSRPAAGEPVDERPGEFIELYNAGAEPIALGGYTFTEGVGFAFPGGTALAPGEYLVVAEDPAYIRRVYGITNVLGPWQGILQDGGETIRIEDPLGNTVDEVRYVDGGDWPETADGDGSSLEITDPRQDNSLGTAWEGSDETDKAPWVERSYSGPYSPQGESSFHLTPLEAGSFLLDDVEVIRSGTNFIPNGGFESGTSPWILQGTLVHSRRTTEEAHGGGASLEVIATARGDTRTNRLMVLTTPSLSSGTYTVRFWARWRRGANVILAHFFDNALAQPLWLPVPQNLGTPGRENGATRRLREAAGAVNQGPLVSPVLERPVRQWPVRPGPGEGVTVTASLSDPDGIESARVRYRTGSLGNGIFQSASLAPIGSDARGEMEFAAPLPGFPLGTKVLFYIEARDGDGVENRYPRDAPARTLLYQVGRPIESVLPVYRFYLDDEMRAELESRSVFADDPLPGSLVFDDKEIYYQVGVHYQGSPWSRTTALKKARFSLQFPSDRTLHGRQRVNITTSGQSLAEATAYHTMGLAGSASVSVPRSDYRFLRWEVFGEDRGTRGQIEPVNGQYIDRWFPAASRGLLHRADALITFQANGEWDDDVYAALEYRGSDPEAYRWNWALKTRELEDDWNPFIELASVMDPERTPSGPEADRAIEALLDAEQFLRVFAVRVLNDDDDSLGMRFGINSLIYRGAEDATGKPKWKMIPWDMDLTYRDSGTTLLPEGDPGIARLLERPEFLRVFLQAYESLVEDSWNIDRLSPFLDETAELTGASDADEIKAFVRDRTARVRALLAQHASGGFRILTNGGNDLTVDTPSIAIDGEAPLAVETILIGGEPPAELAWTRTTGWKAAIDLLPGPNRLDFQGFDRTGALIGRAEIDVASTAEWAPPRIESNEPASGPAAGGTVVRVRGADFRRGIEVFFGSVSAGRIEYISASEIEALSPPGEGTVALRAVNRDGGSAQKDAAFAYTQMPFVRGDADGDSEPSLTDAVVVLEYLFRDGFLRCEKAADANDDGFVDITDAIALLFHLFAGGPAIPEPFPASGQDPTADGLSCDAAGS